MLYRDVPDGCGTDDDDIGGVSAEQIPVLIARDRNKATTDQILPDRSEKSIAAVLEPVVAKSAILVSDGAKAYRAFANRAGIAHVELNVGAGEHRWGKLHLVEETCGVLRAGPVDLSFELGDLEVLARDDRGVVGHPGAC